MGITESLLKSKIEKKDKTIEILRKENEELKNKLKQMPEFETLAKQFEEKKMELQKSIDEANKAKEGYLMMKRDFAKLKSDYAKQQIALLEKIKSEI